MTSLLCSALKCVSSGIPIHSFIEEHRCSSSSSSSYFLSFELGINYLKGAPLMAMMLLLLMLLLLVSCFKPLVCGNNFRLSSVLLHWHQSRNLAVLLLAVLKIMSLSFSFMTAAFHNSLMLIRLNYCYCSMHRQKTGKKGFCIFPLTVLLIGRFCALSMCV